MNMRITFLLCFAPVFFVSQVRAAGASVTVTPCFVSQYMFRGVRLGGPSFEPSSEVNSGNFTLGIWTNFPIEDKVPGQSDPEIDLYSSYALTVNGPVSITPGFTWYDYPNADTNNGFFKSTLEPDIALNYKVAGWKFTLAFYYDLALKGQTFELTAAYVILLKDLGSELDWTATAGTFRVGDASKGANPLIKNRGNYYLIGISSPFAITGKSKLSVGFTCEKGDSNFFKAAGTPRVENTAAVGRGVFTLSYVYNF